MNSLTYWSKSFKVNSFLVNSQGKLGLYNLLNILQDTAWEHAIKLGVGADDISQHQMFWVLARQKLKMKHWPKLGDDIEICTWVRPGEGIFALREFTIHLNSEEIGSCSTTWLTLDTQTRKPVKFDGESVFEKYKSERSLSFMAQKVPVHSDAVKLASFSVRNSDIDFNQHVNNTKYAQWILDSIPMNRHTQKLLEYEINFLTETKLGDTVHIEFVREPEVDKSKPYSVFFQGQREADGKIVFTAKFLTLLC